MWGREYGNAPIPELDSTELTGDQTFKHDEHLVIIIKKNQDEPYCIVYLEEDSNQS